MGIGWLKSNKCPPHWSSDVLWVRINYHVSSNQEDLLALEPHGNVFTSLLKEQIDGVGHLPENGFLLLSSIALLIICVERTWASLYSMWGWIWELDPGWIRIPTTPASLYQGSSWMEELEEVLKRGPQLTEVAGLHVPVAPGHSQCMLIADTLKFAL